MATETHQTQNAGRHERRAVPDDALRSPVCKRPALENEPNAAYGSSAPHAQGHRHAHSHRRGSFNRPNKGHTVQNPTLAQFSPALAKLGSSSSRPATGTRRRNAREMENRNPEAGVRRSSTENGSHGVRRSASENGSPALHTPRQESRDSQKKVLHSKGSGGRQAAVDRSKRRRTTKTPSGPVAGGPQQKAVAERSQQDAENTEKQPALDAEPLPADAAAEKEPALVAENTEAQPEQDSEKEPGRVSSRARKCLWADEVDEAFVDDGDLESDVSIIEDSSPRKYSDSDQEFCRDPLTDKQLSRRQRDIDLGKGTLGYQNYVTLIAKEERSPTCPHTPNKNETMSRKSWDATVGRWRIRLHNFDHPRDMDSEVSASPMDRSNETGHRAERTPRRGGQVHGAENTPRRGGQTRIEASPRHGLRGNYSMPRTPQTPRFRINQTGSTGSSPADQGYCTPGSSQGDEFFSEKDSRLHANDFPALPGSKMVESPLSSEKLSWAKKVAPKQDQTEQVVETAKEVKENAQKMARIEEEEKMEADDLSQNNEANNKQPSSWADIVAQQEEKEMDEKKMCMKEEEVMDADELTKKIDKQLSIEENAVC